MSLSKYKLAVLVSLLVVLGLFVVFQLYQPSQQYKAVLKLGDGIQPVSYWNFNDASNPTRDVQGVSQLTYDQRYVKQVSQQGRKYVQVPARPGNLSIANNPSLNSSQGATWEFVFRPVDKQRFANNTFNFFYQGGAKSRLYLALENPAAFKFRWSAYLADGYCNKADYNPGDVCLPPFNANEKWVFLDGSNPDDRTNLDYYLDDKWHHIVATYDSNTGFTQLYLDGIRFFNEYVTPGPLPDLSNAPNPIGLLGTSINFQDTRPLMDIDQLAVYGQAIDEKQIYQHYIDAIVNNRDFSFTKFKGKVPSTQPLVELPCQDYYPGFDRGSIATRELLDFDNRQAINILTAEGRSVQENLDTVELDPDLDNPIKIYSQLQNNIYRQRQNNPDFVIETQVEDLNVQNAFREETGDGTSCGKRVIPMMQLEEFPAPRYNEFVPMKPMDFWAPTGNITSRAENGSFGQLQNDPRFETTLRTEPLIRLARDWNYYMQLSSNVGNIYLREIANKRYTIFHTVETAKLHPEFPISVQTYWSQNGNKYPKITKLDLEDRYYIEYFLSQGSHYMSPAAPTDIVVEDGQEMKKILEGIGDLLGSRKISLVTDNNEVPPYVYSDSYFRPNSAEERDARAEGGFTKQDGTINWYAYQSQRKAEHFYNLYMSQFENLDMFERDATINWYQAANWGEWAEGQRFFHDWHYLKNTTRDATPDFYPQSPAGWRVMAGSFRGFEAFDMVKTNDELDADSRRLYRPFVAAGWRPEPERNLPPGQWLGFLKAVVVVGAESMYPGYFNGTYTNENGAVNVLFDEWVWQLAIPSYAQAIGSQVKDFLTDGTLLQGDVKFNPAFFPSQPGKTGHEFLGSDLRSVIVIRESEDKNKLLIAGSKQLGTVPATATITVQGRTLTFPVRRQGSVYIYDKNDQTMLQLDTWHKDAHPWYWPSGDHLFEAELPYDLESTCPRWTLKTDHDGSDYSNFVSYLKLEQDCPPGEPRNENPTLSYKFKVTPDTTGDYVMLLRAKKEGAMREPLKVVVDDIQDNLVLNPSMVINNPNNPGIVIEETLLPDSNGWKYYLVRTKALNALDEGWHRIDISRTEAGIGLQLDQVLISHQPAGADLRIYDYWLTKIGMTNYGHITDHLYHKITLRNSGSRAYDREVEIGVYAREENGGEWIHDKTVTARESLEPGEIVDIEINGEGEFVADHTRDKNYQIKLVIDPEQKAPDSFRGNNTSCYRLNYYYIAGQNPEDQVISEIERIACS